MLTPVRSRVVRQEHGDDRALSQEVLGMEDVTPWNLILGQSLLVSMAPFVCVSFFHMALFAFLFLWGFPSALIAPQQVFSDLSSSSCRILGLPP